MDTGALSVFGFFVGVCAVVLAMGWDAVGGSAESVLRSQGSSGEDRLLRCAQGFCGSLPMFAPARSRGRRGRQIQQMQMWLGRRRFRVQPSDRFP